MAKLSEQKGQKKKLKIQSKHIILVLKYLVPIITPFLCFLIHEYTWRIKKDGGFNSYPLSSITSLQAVLLNIFIFYMVALLLTFLIGKSKISMPILILFSYIMGLTNFYLNMFRSSVFTLSDLLSIRTATAVQGNYEFTINFEIIAMGILSVLLVVMNIVFGFSIPKLDKWWKKLILHLAPGIVAIVSLACLASYLDDDNIDQKIGAFNKTLFSPTGMAADDGYFLQFMYQIRFTSVKKPEGYSVEKAKKILNKYKDGKVWETSSIWPNNDQNNYKEPDGPVDVIVIMNESFSDIAVNGTVTPTEDYMPFIRSLMKDGKDTISGYMYASVLGGNTANTEFEFLTGNSMAFLPQGSVPFQQFIDSKIDSCANLFKSQGYDVVGAHPYVSYAWKRRDVYPLLGFDKVLFAKDMPGLEQLRVFSTDKSFYHYIESHIMNSTNPLFSFNVTIQNHGGYAGNFSNFTATVKDNNYNNPYLNTYLTLIKHSDDAFKELTEYITRRNRPTIVLMFGDHQPNDSVVQSIYNKKGMNVATLSGANKMVRYKVPVLMWANYDIPEKHDLLTSANYLNGMITKLAGLETTPYQNFLETLRQKVPVISTQGFFDENEQYNDYSKLDNYSSLISDYRTLQYYMMNDN